jgi:hypothetical protein
LPALFFVALAVVKNPQIRAANLDDLIENRRVLPGDVNVTPFLWDPPVRASFPWSPFPLRKVFTRIDDAIDIAEDDWSLRIDGMSAARIYRVPGAPTRWEMVLGRSNWPRSRPVQKRDG